MKVLGFYTYQRFSVGVGLSDEDFRREDFAAFIREVVFEYNGVGWTLLISRDGLVQYNCKKFQEQGEVIDRSWESFDRDGSIEGPLLSHESLWYDYLNHLNVIQFLLECSMHLNINFKAIEFFELGYLDTTRITYEGSVPKRQVRYGGTDREVMIRRGEIRPKDNADCQRFVMPRSVLDDLCSYYLVDLITQDDSIQVLLPVAKALSQHNLRNYDTCVVICWFIAEQYINDEWSDFLSNRSIGGKRKNKLTGNDYTASVKSEILQLCGLISESLYLKLNATRGVRNDIAHEFGIKRATKDQSREALELAREIIEKKLQRKFPFDALGTSIMGL